MLLNRVACMIIDRDLTTVFALTVNDQGIEIQLVAVYQTRRKEAFGPVRLTPDKKASG